MAKELKTTFRIERFGMVEGEGKGRTTGPRLTTGPRFPSNHLARTLEILLKTGWLSDRTLPH